MGKSKGSFKGNQAPKSWIECKTQGREGILHLEGQVARPENEERIDKQNEKRDRKK